MQKFRSALLIVPAILVFSWLFKNVGPLELIHEIYIRLPEFTPPGQSDPNQLDWPGIKFLPAIALCIAALLGFVWHKIPFNKTPGDGARVIALGGVAGALVLLATPLLIGSGFLINVTYALVGVLILLAALGLGLRLLRPPIIPVDLKRMSPVERIFFSTTLGLGVLSLLVFLLGSLGVLNAIFWWIFIVALIAISAGDLRGLIRSFYSPNDLPAAKHTGLGIALIAFLFLWLAAHAAMIWTFPLEFDVLEYHLAAPAHYLRSGQISFLRENVYATFPETGEMSYLLAIILTADKLRALPAAHVVLAGTWLFTIAGIYAFVLRLQQRGNGDSTDSTAAALAAVLYALIPYGTQLAADFYVEHFQAAFHLAAIFAAYMFLKLQQNSEPGAPRIGGWLALSGVLAGFACATKYTALLFTFAPVGAAIFLFSLRDSVPSAFGRAAVFALSAVPSFAPWLVRNALASGDPIHPLGLVMHRRLSGIGATPDRIDFFETAHRGGSLSIREFFGTLFGFFPPLGKQKDWMRETENGHHLLMFAPAAFINAQRTEFLFLAGIFAADIAVWFLFTHRLNRFLYPLLAPLVILSGWGLATMFACGVCRVIAATACAALIVLIAPITTFWIWFYSDIAYISGAYKPDKAMRAAYGNSAWMDAWVEINKLPAESRVLFVGEAQTFYVNRTPEYATVFNAQLLEDIIRETGSAAEIAKRLKEQGVTHILFNNAEWFRHDTSYAIKRVGKRWEPAKIEMTTLRQLAKDLAFGNLVEYRKGFPSEVYPAYFTLDAKGYEVLQEFVRDYSIGVWKHDEGKRTLCQIRFILPGKRERPDANPAQ